MEINSISKYLINADMFCDNLPVISSVTNLVDLFLKCVIVPFKPKTTFKNSYQLINLKKSDYFTHLHQKSFVLCALLLIPLFGQIIYYSIQASSKNRFLNALDNSKGFQQGTNLISIHSNEDEDTSLTLKSLHSYLPSPIKVKKVNVDQADLFVYVFKNHKARPLAGFSSWFERYFVQGIVPSVVMIGLIDWDIKQLKPGEKVRICPEAMQEEPLLRELYKRGRVIFSEELDVEPETMILGKPFCIQ